MLAAVAAAAASCCCHQASAATAAASLSSSGRRAGRRAVPPRPLQPQEQAAPLQQQQPAAAPEEEEEEKRIQLPPVSLLDEYLPLLLQDIERMDEELDRELEGMFDDVGVTLGLKALPPGPARRTTPRAVAAAAPAPLPVAARRKSADNTKAAAAAVVRGPYVRAPKKKEEAAEEEGYLFMASTESVYEPAARLVKQRRRATLAARSTPSFFQDEEEDEEEDELGSLALRPPRKSRSSSSSSKKLRSGKTKASRRRLLTDKEPLALKQKKKKKSKKHDSHLADTSDERRRRRRSNSRKKKKSSKRSSSSSLRRRRRHPGRLLSTPALPSTWAMAGASLSAFGWACLAVQEIQRAGLMSHVTYFLNPFQVLLSLTVGPALLFVHGGGKHLSSSSSSIFLRALTWSSLLYGLWGLLALAKTRPPAVCAVAFLALPLLLGTAHTHDCTDVEEPRHRPTPSLVATGLLTSLLTVGLPMSLTEASLLLRLNPPTSSSGPWWALKLGALAAAMALSQMSVTTFRDAQARLEVYGPKEEGIEEEEEEGGGLSRASKRGRMLGALATMALCVAGMGPGVVFGSLFHMFALARLSAGGKVRGKVGRTLAEVQGGVWAMVGPFVGEALALPPLEAAGEEGVVVQEEEEELGQGEAEVLYELDEDELADLVVVALKQQQAQKQVEEDEGRESQPTAAAAAGVSSSPLFGSSASRSRASGRPLSSSSSARAEEEKAAAPLEQPQQEEATQ